MGNLHRIRKALISSRNVEGEIMWITRRQLTRKVVESGVPKKHAKIAVAAVLDAVWAGLEKHDKVSLTSSDGSIILTAEKY